MAVSWAVLVVIVVAVSQVECATISQPEPLPDNRDVIPQSTDYQETPGSDPQKKSNAGLLENQVKQHDPEKPPDGNDLNSPPNDALTTNSHTITSQDFAAMTGVVSQSVPDNGDSNYPESSEATNGQKLSPSPDRSDLSIDDNEAQTEPDNKYLTAHNGEENTELETYEGISHAEEQPSIGATTHDKSPTASEDNISEVSLYELSQSISDEIKVYSNEVVVNWESKTGGSSWALEAESVLKDYMDKISIAQSANNSNCVKKDLENHASRTKSLQDVIDFCRSNQKREDWHKLREITKNTLNKITEIVQGATTSIGNLSKDDDNYSTKKMNIENETKEKLQELNSDDLKTTLSKMKEKAIKSDEKEYTNCLDNKPEKGMIVDTLNDIMRIKNNCVG